MACSLPASSGIPLSRWSRREIARQLIRMGVVPSISGSTVGQWLAQEKLKPWRYHAWQQPTDPRFLERAAPVLDYYRQAQELLAAGVWGVCCDEKTSIQARAHSPGRRPAQPHSPSLVPDRYVRKGATTLFAGYSVADGQVLGMSRRRKRFVDFQAFLKGSILPEARRRRVKKLLLILDNGSTHAPKQLASWLRQYVWQARLNLEIVVLWLPVHASWLDQVELFFSILQRQLLTPNDFPSLEALDHAILQFIAYYNHEAKPFTWTYTKEKLAAKLAVKLDMDLAA